jgi:hypothetical protein
MIHPATAQILRWFNSDHLSYNPALQEVVKPFEKMAYRLAEQYDGPEVTAGLRKLLEAKDCIVRAHVAVQDQEKIVNS